MKPSVCAIMLTSGRNELAKRAVDAFRAQTYDATRRVLVVLDSGAPYWLHPEVFAENEVIYQFASAGLTIGELRNIAIKLAPATDIIVHWDDDDWSHPNRITEQVALLQESGAEAVGYREMLFWRERTESKSGDVEPGQAWVYFNADQRYCLGTSLCYWRRVWEKKPFEALPVARGGTGEDSVFIRDLKTLGIRSTPWVWAGNFDGDPRMIARIHALNTQDYSREQIKSSPSWTRLPHWDDHCRAVMA